jgi:hypothetical protein
MTIVLIALVTGVALGVAASALFVARGHAIGWLVVVDRRQPGHGSLPPSRPTGAANLGWDDGSRLAAGDRAAARSGLDAAGQPRTIQARPGTGHPQITSSYDRQVW